MSTISQRGLAFSFRQCPSHSSNNFQHFWFYDHLFFYTIPANSVTAIFGFGDRSVTEQVKLILTTHFAILMSVWTFTTLNPDLPSKPAFNQHQASSIKSRLLHIPGNLPNDLPDKHAFSNSSNFTQNNYSVFIIQQIYN